ncbi:MAG: glycosyl transferase family 1, partial [Dictyoglomus sp. NZ13-RE01]
MMRKIKVNIIFKPGIPSARKKGGGDQTACKMLYSALQKRDDVEVYYNANLKDGPFDIIHFHSLGNSFFKFLKTHENIIITAHVIPDTMIGSAILAERWKNIFTQYLLLFYNSAKIVIAVSPSEKAKLEEMGVTSKVIYIPNGIDTEKFRVDLKVRKMMRELYNIKENEIVIICSGHTIKRKGFDSFVKVAKSLPQYKFFWIGGIPFSFLSSGYSEVKRVQASPPPNLFLPGPQPHEEIYKFYNMADIFFF